jgi:hypothetical protein
MLPGYHQDTPKIKAKSTKFHTIHKAMTEAQFRKEQKRFLREQMQYIKSALEKKLDKAFASGAIPDYWKARGDHRTTNAVIDSFDKERQYSMLDTQNKKDADNLHLFL